MCLLKKSKDKSMLKKKCIDPITATDCPLSLLTVSYWPRPRKRASFPSWLPDIFIWTCQGLKLEPYACKPCALSLSGGPSQFKLHVRDDWKATVLRNWICVTRIGGMVLDFLSCLKLDYSSTEYCHKNERGARGMHFFLSVLQCVCKMCRLQLLYRILEKNFWFRV